MTDPRNFYLLSDYPMDKICWMMEVAVKNGEDKTVPHGLPFRPVLMGNWSKSADFSSAVYDIRTRLAPAGGQSFVGGSATIDDTSVRVFFVDYNEDGSFNPSAVAYFRLFGFAPDDALTVSTGGVEINNRLMINSDSNYLKLYQTGKLSSGQAVAHGLGYVPKIVVNEIEHTMNTRGTYNVEKDGSVALEAGSFVNDQAVRLVKGEWDQPDVVYRVYVD